ncbi:MAG: hypothetical protein VKL00_12410 [Synechococcales bacterium]|nr:hypothetical protein [Cyanobacteria bacterium REEB444]MEB3126406.1 hypothetical protein [Synechococcales bacterium]
MTTNPTSFLTPEESIQVDKALLSPPEKFLTRLTISSLRLLTQIARDQNCAIEQLSPREIIDWFENEARQGQDQPSSGTFLQW